MTKAYVEKNGARVPKCLDCGSTGITAEIHGDEVDIYCRKGHCVATVYLDNWG